MSKLQIVIFLLLAVSIFSEGEDDAAYLQMRRTSCLVLSRYHSNTQKELIQGTVQSLPPTDQNKYINKLYATAVLKCQQSITQSQVQQFYVQNNNFDPTQYFYLLQDMDYTSISQNLELSKEEQSVVKFAKKFDQEMQIREQQKKAKQQQQTGAEQKYEMKFLGISIKDIPDTAKIIYIIIFVAIIGGALFYGISQLDKQQKGTNKRKKSPKKENKKD